MTSTKTLTPAERAMVAQRDRAIIVSRLSREVLLAMVASGRCAEVKASADYAVKLAEAWHDGQERLFPTRLSLEAPE